MRYYFLCGYLTKTPCARIVARLCLVSHGSPDHLVMLITSILQLLAHGFVCSMACSDSVTNCSGINHVIWHWFCMSISLTISSDTYASASFQSLHAGREIPLTHKLFCIIYDLFDRLVKHGRHAEALAVISAIDNKPYTDPDVQRTYTGIRETIASESGHDGDASLKELFTHGRSQNFRRACLGVVNQCFQQITGINLIT